MSVTPLKGPFPIISPNLESEKLSNIHSDIGIESGDELVTSNENLLGLQAKESSFSENENLLNSSMEAYPVYMENYEQTVWAPESNQPIQVTRNYVVEEKSLNIDQLSIDGLDKAIEQYFQTHTFNLEIGTKVLADLENRCHRANQKTDQRESSAINQVIEKIKPLVAELQLASLTLIRQDLRVDQSFFQPSLETIFTDIDGTEYVIADNSQLLSSALAYSENTHCYQGVEVSKKYRVEWPNNISYYLSDGDFSHVCDLVLFQKTDLQAAMEHSLIFECWDFFIRSVWSSSSKEDLLKIQQIQQKMFKDIFNSLREKIKIWEYSGFVICIEQEELLSLGLSTASAKRYHAIALFLPPSKNSFSFQEQIKEV